MIESFPAETIGMATKMANNRIKELKHNYKPIQINTVKDGTKHEPSYSVVVLFEVIEGL